jgi:hypothetical protein
MSFGFHDPGRTQLAHLQKAIASADGQRVILMAATSNNGGLDDLPYPAKDYRVFGINASDGFGEKTNFNPPPQRRSCNFSILGVDVMSAWPSFLELKPTAKKRRDTFLRQDMRGTWKCLSGTSVAAPVAAALAALLFQHFRVRINDGEFSPLECYTGLERVFDAMSRESPVSPTGFNNLVPWLGRGKRFRRYWEDDKIWGMTNIIKDLLDIHEMD